MQDWQPSNKSVIYIEDFSNAGHLSEYLQQLGDNETEYKSYMNHKIHRRIENQMLLKHLVMRHYSHRGDQPGEDNSLLHRFECIICRHIQAKSYLKRPAPTKQHYNCPLPPVYAPLEHRQMPKYGPDWRSMMGIGRCQAKLLNQIWQANRSITNKEFVAHLNEMVSKDQCEYPVDSTNNIVNK